MGLFSRRDSTTSQDPHSRSRNTSTVSTSRQSSVRGSCEHGSEKRTRKVHERGSLGSPRVESGFSTPCSTPASPLFDVTLTSQGIPSRTSSIDATEQFGHVRSNSVAQQLLSRGRRLKASASKLSLSSLASEQTAQTHRRSHSRKGSDGYSSRPGSKAPSPTRSISSPTDFQHMTHIESQEFAKIQSTNESDFVADFSAMRASQHQRRDFRGIRTVELHSRNSSVETSSTNLSPSDRSSFQSTPNTSANSSSRSSQSIDANAYAKSHTRKTRSQDSFSQPFASGRPPKLGVPIITPPRISSRRAVPRIDDGQSTEMRKVPKPLVLSSYESHDVPLRIRSSPLREQEEAAGSSEDEYKTSEPNSPISPNDSWPLASLGEALSIVDEEEAGPAAAPRRGSRRSSSVMMMNSPSSKRGSRCEPLSSGSSSEESSATITAASYSRAMERRHERQPTVQKLAPSFARLAVAPVEQRVSMRRSSLNGGLFTSWAVDDDDEGTSEQDFRSVKKQRLQTPIHVRQAEVLQPTKQRKVKAEEDEITALPSSTKSTVTRSKSTKRSSKGSEKAPPLSRSLTTSKPPAKLSPRTTSTSKHDRHASEPPTSVSASSRDPKPSKQRVSFT